MPPPSAPQNDNRATLALSQPSSAPSAALVTFETEVFRFRGMTFWEIQAEAAWILPPFRAVKQEVKDLTKVSADLLNACREVYRDRTASEDDVLGALDALKALADITRRKRKEFDKQIATVTALLQVVKEMQEAEFVSR